MNREETGADVLLAEPEIVAWLGLTKKHDDAPRPAWRARVPSRRSEALLLDPRATRAIRALKVGIVL